MTSSDENSKPFLPEFGTPTVFISLHHLHITFAALNATSIIVATFNTTPIIFTPDIFFHITIIDITLIIVAASNTTPIIFTPGIFFDITKIDTIVAITVFDFNEKDEMSHL
ncbi:hypothetical protein K0M31_001121 [Melipona bicolor]|uniref:Transmembrane protein n=1 Tax=Melipona bicolor TaxID=60889 RepID=A0AA40GF28_9HYME|nr:hypothetical protein K0M31_001121 [Melipona bicolor]